MPTRQGSFRLFRLFGITVYLHWIWLVMAYFQIQYRIPLYHSPVFGALEYLALFSIVLLHEFGHQLACRSVGGKTHDIVIWFLGGVAYVTPPQRPGATLWSIVGGPLVNVLLIPIFSIVILIGSRLGWHDTNPDLYLLFHNLWLINMFLLCFNILPIYPMDGGQILRALLWFLVGQANSLLAVSVIGFVGVAGLIGLSILLFLSPATQSAGSWFLVISVYTLFSCWGGLMQAKTLAKLAKAPRHGDFRCPECQTPPPVGYFWRCSQCRQPFDTFANRGVCPHCRRAYTEIACGECGSAHPIAEWQTGGSMPPPLP